MARPLLSLLCGAVALLLPWIAGETVRCSRPKAVDNAHIDAGNSTQLHACLRYTCKPGYKRKAGTSGLIQCVLHDSKPVWTPASLQCIRDPALPLQTPSPELPPVLPTMRTSQRVSAQILASSIGLPLLVIAGVVACCCWRMKMSSRQEYEVAGTAIAMVARATAAEDDETVPPGVFPMG
ncbi:interleukin-15 receptor subunit alpha isoform X3 [Anas acuta]|uniref:interleukin-15 receptor subunit alpha isoform X3 n=1 Tax=Anas acuta TaxID=28680 RepID=UPI000F7CD2C1|eukprot:XP_027317292.1 interleukin-15 receptor subunit alpha isoform X6 [Anas platyrhynchos]